MQILRGLAPVQTYKLGPRPAGADSLTWDGNDSLGTRAPDSVWRGITFVRDTVPPVLTLTNPPASVTAQPWAQVQGWANEPLAFVRYDLTNATGLQTNLAGYVIKQFLDTNTLQYTTNWFQCYDVALTTNLNILTFGWRTWRATQPLRT